MSRTHPKIRIIKYYPVTPGGTVCDWLESYTEDEAWSRLMEDAKHMPYENKQAFIDRGYTVESDR